MVKVKKITKKSSSMRESAQKSREDATKTKRIRRAATAAAKPVGKVRQAIKQEFHVIPQKQGGFLGFLSKSRRLTPRYISDSLKELKFVTWPGRKETWKLVFAVFLFAIVLGLFISVLDFGLEKLLREVIL